MRIFDSISDVNKDTNTTLTLGTFDGVHIGHRKIIEKLNEKAQAHNGRNFLITFSPHPRSVIGKDFGNNLLSSRYEKIVLLEELGIENLLVINFTKEFSQFKPETFIKEYLIDQIGLKEIVIGHDHHFGKGRGGDESTLRELGNEYGFEVTSVEAVNLNGETVSSSKIRNDLTKGNVLRVKDFLNRYYSFRGKVIEGDKRGRELGFPTANIELDEKQKMLPAIGIYFVETIIENDKHFGLLSIGKRPTFYKSGSIIPEVYIYDFSSDIYGKEVSIKIIERLREEIKYNSADELIVQMNKDKFAGVELIKRYKEVLTNN